MEANYSETSVGYETLFIYPHNAAISVGLIGAFHDNHRIKISPGETPKVPNQDGREYKISGSYALVTHPTRPRLVEPDESYVVHGSGYYPRGR